MCTLVFDRTLIAHFFILMVLFFFSYYIFASKAPSKIKIKITFFGKFHKVEQ